MGLDGAHEGHTRSLRREFSVQIQPTPNTKQQLNPPPPVQNAMREPSQQCGARWRTVMGEDSAVVTCCGRSDHGVMMGWFVVVDPA